MKDERAQGIMTLASALGDGDSLLTNDNLIKLRFTRAGDVGLVAQYTLEPQQAP